MQFKAKEKGEQPKLFTQLPHLLECFTKHPLEKHPIATPFLSVRREVKRVCSVNALTKKKSVKFTDFILKIIRKYIAVLTL